MRERPRRRLAAALLLCLFAAALAGCGPGLSDWSYDLPNGYAIWRSNSMTINLGKKTSDYSMENRIDSYISAFCYDERYVCVKRLRSRDDPNAAVFYAVDTLEDSVFGPFTADELAEKMKELDTALPGEWIQTVPRPKGASN